MQKFLITYAQNATPVHKAFWEACRTFARVESAELVVIAGRYKNPTSVFAKPEVEGEWWAPEVTPFLCRKRRRLAPNLMLFGDISIQPTASRPLNGFEVFMGGHSGIFGHTKRALETIPTATRTPRIAWTTSACTVKNYTDSKAGAKGKAHHVLGALVVEIDSDGCCFARHVTWASKTGAFTDINRAYSASGCTEAPPAASLVLGDWHAGLEDDDVLHATYGLLESVRPKNVVLHDVLDFGIRNHHGYKNPRIRFDTHAMKVEDEVRGAVAALNLVAGSWASTTGLDYKTWVVRSNHDEHFERWMAEHQDEQDPINARYWHEMKARDFLERDRKGGWANMFEAEARRLGVPKSVHFLGRNDSLRILGVDHAFHGDKGLGGSRGSPGGYVKLGVKVSAGHTHVARICDGYYGAGVTARLDHEYNILPSNWVNAHVLLGADGKRQLIIIVRGRFKGGMI